MDQKKFDIYVNLNVSTKNHHLVVDIETYVKSRHSKFATLGYTAVYWRGFPEESLIVQIESSDSKAARETVEGLKAIVGHHFVALDEGEE